LFQNVLIGEENYDCKDWGISAMMGNSVQAIGSKGEFTKANQLDTGWNFPASIQALSF